MMKTTITVSCKNGKLSVENSFGQKWEFKKMSESTAIAAIVFYTIDSTFQKWREISENFRINFAMDINEQ